MPYDADPRTVQWFERALLAPSPRIRCRAVTLLRDVDFPAREAWLCKATRDSDPRVAALAVVVAALPEVEADAMDLELFESDFATGEFATALRWEWEYEIVVCHELYVPSAGMLVWIREENDAQAKELALLKACVGQLPEHHPHDTVPIITDKRFVNLYTRSPRSLAEAMRWSVQGRPAYHEPT